MLGIEVQEVSAGRATARMRVRADMVNSHDIAHGGLIFAAPARLDDDLVAEALLRTRFGRNGIYNVTVRRGATVIAELSGRSHELGQRLPSPAEGADDG